MTNQCNSSYRRKLTVGGILFILLVTVIYVAIETEIIDVWKQTTTFTFDWIFANWYQFASASNLSISQNNDSSWPHASARHIRERLGKPLKIGYSTKVFGEAWICHKCLNSCPELKNRCVNTADRCQYNYAGVTFFHMRDSFHISWHIPPFQKCVFALM